MIQLLMTLAALTMNLIIIYMVMRYLSKQGHRMDLRMYWSVLTYAALRLPMAGYQVFFILGFDVGTSIVTDLLSLSSTAVLLWVLYEHKRVYWQRF